MWCIYAFQDDRNKCSLYQFLDDELPSQYYKDLVFELHNSVECFKMDNESTMLFEEGLKLKEDLKVANGKLQLYERLFRLMLGGLSVLCVVIGVLVY